MAHLTARSGYDRLIARIDKFPPGARPSTLLRGILAALCSERDAELLAQLPLRPFRTKRAARAWGVTEARARQDLDDLAARGLLLDGDHEGHRLYVFPPPMAGFFEFALMRVREGIDQALLARLLFEYINVDDEHARRVYGSRVPQGRALLDAVALGTLPDEDRLLVLDHERAEELLRQAEHIAVSMCFCRHKMAHAGRACEAPMESCLSLDFAADSLARHGYARRIELAEALAILDRSRDGYLVQIAENVRHKPKFICNCCSCCCDALLAVRRFEELRPLETTAFLPQVDSRACSACGRCVERCPVGCLSTPTPGSNGCGPRPPEVDTSICIGCGLCVRACSTRAVTMRRTNGRVIAPVNTAHRVALQAIEDGRLSNLVFDGQGRAGQRALSAVLGAVLDLPPAKQILANRQLQSRYLEAVCDRPRWDY